MAARREPKRTVPVQCRKQFRDVVKGTPRPIDSPEAAILDSRRDGGRGVRRSAGVAVCGFASKRSLGKAPGARKRAWNSRAGRQPSVVIFRCPIGLPSSPGSRSSSRNAFALGPGQYYRPHPSILSRWREPGPDDGTRGNSFWSRAGMSGAIQGEEERSRVQGRDRADREGA